MNGEWQYRNCKQKSTFSLHFAFQPTSENKEFGNGLGFGRKYAILTHFSYHFDNQAIILSLSFLYVFVLQKHSYWRVKAMILGGKSYDIAA